MYNDVGLKIFGTEISLKIVNHTKKFFKKSSLNIQDLSLGFNHKLDYKPKLFDILVSWNACYYMSLTPNNNFELNLKEFSRVLKWKIFDYVHTKKNMFYLHRIALKI